MSQRTFTYQEALAQFPKVRDLTEAAVNEVHALMQGVSSRDEMTARRDEIEIAYREIVERWRQDVLTLGCEVKGLWLVDWDSGDGYYCWQYPEEALAYYHSYEEGFSGRVPIA